jgi:hypothetical protein
VTATPNAPTPTTPATAEQLREDAKFFRQRAQSIHGLMSANGDDDYQQDIDSYQRAAAALDAEAARLEAPHAELSGWGVMRPDGTLLPFIADNGEDASESRRYVEHHIETFGSIRQRHRAVPVRLTTEGATDAK